MNITCKKIQKDNRGVLKLLSYILCAILIFSATVINTEAQESGGVVCDFVPLEEEQSYYIFSKADKPELEVLQASFPQTLEVYVDGQTEAVSVDVSWYCVGEEYTDPDSYYFQFSPMWDESIYPLREGLDVVTDAPYIAVFLTDDDAISTLSVTSNPNEMIIYQFLRYEMGLNAAAASGILANIYHESSFNPNALGDGGTSYGICQWHNTRWESLKNWCTVNGYDWTTLEGQLNYLKYELSRNNSSILWNGKTIYNYISQVPNTAEGAYSAGYYWCYYYEIPANKQVVSKTRGNLAKNTYWPEYCEDSEEIRVSDAKGITQVKVTDVSEAGYTVTCVIEDIDKIERVQFPTWTAANGQDDLATSWETSQACQGTIDGNTITYRVNAADHNNESGLYLTQIYVYNKDGSIACAPVAANLGANVLTPKATMDFDGNHYELYVVDEAIADRIPWTWAKTYAESLGGHLVTINSQAEQTAINAMISSETSGYWIGATDEAVEGNWKWVTGEPVSYTNWASGEPNDTNKTQNYAVQWPGVLKWDDDANDSAIAEYGFICEFEGMVKDGIVYDKNAEMYYYYDNGIVDTTVTGLVYYEAEGKYLYFEEGVWNTEKYGLVEYGGGQFLVANGAIATEISGLQPIGDNFYFLANGQLQNQYTGLALYDNEWFYVVDGVLQIGYYGLLDYDGSKFLIATGQIQNSYTGLYNDPATGDWYYIVYGQVQTQYTSLVAYDGAWFYLVNGILDADYTGTVIYDGAEFYVVNGMVVA